MKILFAWRYLKSKKTTNAVQIISIISMIAIGVGTAALIIVLSVFNGIEDLVKSLYGDFYADAKITATHGKTIHLTQQQLYSLQKLNGVQVISLIAEEKAILKNGENQTTVVVKGVDEYYTKVNNIIPHLIRGSFNLGSVQQPQIVIGAGIESATAIGVEQSLENATLYLPNKNATNISNVNDAFISASIVASGTFMVQQEFDNKYIFTNLAFLKYMLDMPINKYSSAELKIDATNDKENNKIIQSIANVLGSNYQVTTRYQQNQSLYTVMKMEKWFIYAILSLILVIAAFNMIGALTMLVLEKQKDIAVLKALGANNWTIENIFIVVGLLLATLGSIIGISIASLICWAQQHFKLIKLGGGSFIIDYYPVKMQLQDYILVLFTVFIIALTASLIPARKASRERFSLKS